MIRGSASWVRESVQTLAGMIVDNAPLAFTLFVWLHVIPFSYATVMAGLVAAGAALFVFSLWCAPRPFHPALCGRSTFACEFRATGFLGPLAGYLASNGAHSCFMIMAGAFCLSGPVALSGLALYDFGTVCVSAGSMIARLSRSGVESVEHEHMVELHNQTTALMEQGYATLQDSYAAEPWWPVAQGIRGSIADGQGGVALLDRAYEDAEAIYAAEEWWPAVSSARVLVNQLQAKSDVEEQALDYGAVYAGLEQIVGDPAAFFKQVGQSLWGSIGGGIGALQTILAAAVGSLSTITASLTLISGWAIKFMTFSFFILPGFCMMESDILGVQRSRSLKSLDLTPTCAKRLVQKDQLTPVFLDRCRRGVRAAGKLGEDEAGV